MPPLLHHNHAHRTLNLHNRPAALLPRVHLQHLQQRPGAPFVRDLLRRVRSLGRASERLFWEPGEEAEREGGDAVEEYGAGEVPERGGCEGWRGYRYCGEGGQLVEKEEYGLKWLCDGETMFASFGLWPLTGIRVLLGFYLS